jgi:hypothetical protein
MGQYFLREMLDNIIQNIKKTEEEEDVKYRRRKKHMYFIQGGKSSLTLHM